MSDRYFNISGHMWCVWSHKVMWACNVPSHGTLGFLIFVLEGGNTILTGIFKTVIGIPPENNTGIFSNIIHHCSIYLKTAGTGFKGVRHTWWVAEEGTGSRSQFPLHSFKLSFSVTVGSCINPVTSMNLQVHISLMTLMIKESKWCNWTLFQDQ